MISALQGGTVEATIVLPSAVANLVREFKILDLPYVFEDEQHAARVFDGPVGKRLLEYLPGKGLTGLGFMELGFRNFPSTVWTRLQ
jgi:TRAP-type transport system periplasmic protein